jgi:hypothetical protein
MKSENILEQFQTISIEDAEMIIGEIRQNVAAMGANDSEFFQLDQIRKKLLSKELEPSLAAEEARKILSNKQDYH